MIGPATEFDPEFEEAHAEASNEGGEGAEEIQEASPEALAAAESAESAASDLVGEGEPLREGAAETGPEGEGVALLLEAGSELEGGEEFAFLAPLAAKLVPMLVSTAGPSLARAIMAKLSPRAKRLLERVRQGAGMTSVLQKLMAQALKRPESGEEASVDEALAQEMTEAMELIIDTDDRVRIKNTMKVPWRRYCALRIEFPTGAT